MKKSLTVLVGLGLAVSLNAGTVACDYPVVKCEPIFKTVFKKIPSKQCWDEQQTSAINFKQSELCTTSGLVVAKKCTVTKCKTVWNTIEEQVLVGYKNYAKVCGQMISKVSNCKMKTIRVTSTY
ncbi:MAG TPA: hypothetical protein EYG95_04900 [Campylobacterales bacterium]|nr:hypothetical protein [Campylobacterales bacterium]